MQRNISIHCINANKINGKIFNFSEMEIIISRSNKFYAKKAIFLSK